jgi:hypothetical protein
MALLPGTIVLKLIFSAAVVFGITLLIFASNNENNPPMPEKQTEYLLSDDEEQTESKNMINNSADNRIGKSFEVRSKNDDDLQSNKSDLDPEAYVISDYCDDSDEDASEKSYAFLSKKIN